LSTEAGGKDTSRATHVSMPQENIKLSCVPRCQWRTWRGQHELEGLAWDVTRPWWLREALHYCLRIVNFCCSCYSLPQLRHPRRTVTTAEHMHTIECPTPRTLNASSRDPYDHISFAASASWWSARGPMTRGHDKHVQSSHTLFYHSPLIPPDRLDGHGRQSGRGRSERVRDTGESSGAYSSMPPAPALRPQGRLAVGVDFVSSHSGGAWSQI
jgi:hypothetical protein